MLDPPGNDEPGIEPPASPGTGAGAGEYDPLFAAVGSSVSGGNRCGPALIIEMIEIRVNGEKYELMVHRIRQVKQSMKQTTADRFSTVLHALRTKIQQSGFCYLMKHPDNLMC
jgi:hypothetical protein